jgi:hypothetical protein
MVIKNDFDLWLAVEHKEAHQRAADLMTAAVATLELIPIDGPAKDEDAKRLKDMIADLRNFALFATYRVHDRNKEIQTFLNRK